MKYCVIGKNLSHSYSTYIHQYMGLQYDLREVSVGDIGTLLKCGEYSGINVTIPYKSEVLKHLDYTSPDAREIGAVNTIKYVDGSLYGYNTDLEGIEYAYQRAGLDVSGRNVVILGSGGASKVASYHAHTHGANKVTIISRSGTNNYTNVYDLKDTDILVNATPVGMYPKVDETPIDLSHFPKLVGILEFVYNPARTMLVKEAERLGLKVARGLDILVAQGLKSESIWLDTTFDLSQIRQVVAHTYSETLNIYLVGMPSCGKSTIGILLAERLGREYIDTDTYFATKYNRTPAQYIRQYGESDFRDKESDILQEISIRHSLIVSTGGGIVEREDNISMMKSNGVVVYVDRDLDKLTCDNRPISQDKGVARLYIERRDKYLGAQDILVDNNGNKNSTVEEIISKYEIACNQRS